MVGKKLPLKNHFPKASQFALGCMHMGGSWDHSAITQETIDQAFELVEHALALGITVFDHADIYTLGKSEQVFGEILKRKPEWRERMIIQTKCGIRFADDDGPKRYDWWPRWIEHSVGQSLERLNTDYIDVLLLHRPDPLMERDKVANCLDRLVASGKVKAVGVSNCNHHQLAYLQQAMDSKLICNQVEMSLGHRDWVESTVLEGSPSPAPNAYTAGTLEHCVDQDIQLQAWAPLAGGVYDPTRDDGDECQIKTRALIKDLSEMYRTSPEAIVIAWLLRHPARIQPILGTSKPERLAACVQAKDIELSRAHWYALFEAARGAPVP